MTWEAHQPAVRLTDIVDGVRTRVGFLHLRAISTFDGQLLGSEDGFQSAVVGVDFVVRPSEDLLVETTEEDAIRMDPDIAMGAKGRVRLHFGTSDPTASDPDDQTRRLRVLYGSSEDACVSWGTILASASTSSELLSELLDPDEDDDEDFTDRSTVVCNPADPATCRRCGYRCEPAGTAKKEATACAGCNRAG